MYECYFRLNERPFSLTPDPKYIYLSAQHEEALAHLSYGAFQQGSGGFSLLSGEIGTGKTTIIRQLLESLPDSTEIAFILNPLLTPKQFLQETCEELQIQHPKNADLRKLHKTIQNHLLQLHAQSKRCLLIVDEAQLLSQDTLECVRLLTNLESDTEKLMQILLIGQPEIRDKINGKDCLQLKQRITAQFHLQALSKQDTFAYIQHRCMVAGAQTALFSPAAMSIIYRASHGVPRMINQLADRALLSAYTRQHHWVEKQDARLARRELLWSEPDSAGLIPKPLSWLGILLLILLALLLPKMMNPTQPAETPPPTSTERNE